MKISRSPQLVAALKAMGKAYRTLRAAELREIECPKVDNTAMQIHRAGANAVYGVICEAVRAALAVEEPDKCRDCPGLGLMASHQWGAIPDFKTTTNAPDNSYRQYIPPKEPDYKAMWLNLKEQMEIFAGRRNEAWVLRQMEKVERRHTK